METLPSLDAHAHLDAARSPEALAASGAVLAWRNLARIVQETGTRSLLPGPLAGILAGV